MHVYVVLLFVALVSFNRVSSVLPQNGGFPEHLNYTITFRDGLFGRDAFHTMGLAWDGCHYISVSGGNTDGNRLAFYSKNGTLMQLYSPGLDFRSIFTTATRHHRHSHVMVRLFGNNTLLRMREPDLFKLSVTLNTSLDSQSHVVPSACYGTYMALMFGGRVDFWNRQGEWLNSIMLQDYGQVLGENQYPAYTNIVAFEHQLITLANSEASVWNCNGTRIARVRLDDVEGTYDIYWSLSVANGLLWLVDEQSRMFRGYQFYQQEKATNDGMSCNGSDF